MKLSYAEIRQKISDLEKALDRERDLNQKLLDVLAKLAGALGNSPLPSLLPVREFPYGDWEPHLPPVTSPAIVAYMAPIPDTPLGVSVVSTTMVTKSPTGDEP